MFDSAYTKIEKRIQTIYQSFDTPYNKTGWEPAKKIESLQVAIKNIQTIISNNYSVPPKYMENLQDINKALSNIINKWFGSNAPQDKANNQE
jgi:hypothetical protein